MKNEKNFELLSTVAKSRGLRAQDVAAALGVTPEYLSRIKHGKDKLTTKFAMKVEEVFGINWKSWDF